MTIRVIDENGPTPTSKPPRQTIVQLCPTCDALKDKLMRLQVELKQLRAVSVLKNSQ